MTGCLRIKHKTYYMLFSWKDEDGKWRQKSESTAIPERGGKRKAQERLDQRLAELKDQSTAALTAKDVLFLEFLRDWLEDRMSLDLRPNTLTQYRQVVENSICQYKPFTGAKLQKLSPALVQSYVNERVKGGLSANSIRKHHCIIHMCLDYAMRLDLIPYNPSDRVELPKKQKYQGAKAFRPEQLQELLYLFRDDPLKDVVQIAVSYGMRRSEICGLRWDAVDFDTNSLYVCHTAVKNQGEIIFSDNTKTATSRRELPITSTMRIYFMGVKAKQEENKLLFGRDYVNSGYVCTKSNGAPIDPDFVTHHFQRVTKAHGFPCRFHDLRHSAVNTLRIGGCDAKDIQSWLGHSDVSTTLNIYGHLMDGDMSRMGAVMDKMLSQDT